jgi:hypothetical protein
MLHLHGTVKRNEVPQFHRPEVILGKEDLKISSDPIPGRSGFIGEEAEHVVRSYYVKKRVPDQYRMKGASNPVRFIEPTGDAKSKQ